VKFIFFHLNFFLMPRRGNPKSEPMVWPSTKYSRPSAETQINSKSKVGTYLAGQCRLFQGVVFIRTFGCRTLCSTGPGSAGCGRTARPSATNSGGQRGWACSLPRSAGGPSARWSRTGGSLRRLTLDTSPHLCTATMVNIRIFSSMTVGSLTKPTSRLDSTTFGCGRFLLLSGRLDSFDGLKFQFV
jgi:hypothetical protein